MILKAVYGDVLSIGLRRYLVNLISGALLLMWEMVPLERMRVKKERAVIIRRIYFYENEKTKTLF